jgi:hypothetical protein
MTPIVRSKKDGSIMVFASDAKEGVEPGSFLTGSKTATRMFGFYDDGVVLPNDVAVTANAEVDSLQPNTNFGSQSMIVGFKPPPFPNWTERGYLYADLSAYAGKTLTLGELHTYANSFVGPTTPAVHDIVEVQQAWGEMTITWNNQPIVAGVALDTNTIAQASVPVWVIWDIKALVQDWLDAAKPNHGVMIRRQAEAPPDSNIVLYRGRLVSPPGERPFFRLQWI